MNRRTWIALALGPMAASCGHWQYRAPTARAYEPPPPHRETGARPAVGVESLASVGDAILTVWDAWFRPALQLDGDLHHHRQYHTGGYLMQVVVRGGLLRAIGSDGDGGVYYSTGARTELAYQSELDGDYYPNGDILLTGVYLDRAGTAHVFWLPSTVFALIPNSRPMLSRAHDLAPRRITPTSAPVPMPGTYRRELVYGGITSGSLSLLYREYLDDFARPAFSQVLTYDPSASDVIGFRGARVRIVQATNTSIRYVVEAALSPYSG